jgi:hypothetical protein
LDWQGYLEIEQTILFPAELFEIHLQGASFDQGVGSDAGAWLITGGLGALGTIAAKWLAGQGKKNLHLLGRTGR